MRHYEFTAAYRAAKAEHVGEAVTFTLGEEELEEDGVKRRRPRVIRCREPFNVVATLDFIERPDTLSSELTFLREVIATDDLARFEAGLRDIDPPLDGEGLAMLVRGVFAASGGRPTSPSGDSSPASSPDGTSSSGAVSGRASRRRSKRASVASG